jgi:hypothetical protein
MIMSSDGALELYAWSAILSSAATILTLITGSLFFTGGKRLGKVNDLFIIIQVLLMIPLVFFFNQLITPPNFLRLMITSLFGLGGILVSALGQIRLVSNKIDFEESQKYFPAGGAIGFWLIMVNVFSRGSVVLPAGLIWMGVGAGIGYLLVVGGFLRGGQGDSFFYGGSLMLGILYPTWGIWLGRLILSSLK